MKYKKNKKYTALIPKTLKATKKISKNTLKQSIIFLNSIKKSVKKSISNFDKKTAKRIHNVTRKLKKL